MKNTFGNSVTLTLFGESHGVQIGAVLDGLAPGIVIDEEYIKKKLSQRRPAGKISTPRVEADDFRIISGVYNGKTTGSPLAITIENTNTQSGDYDVLRETARPSHADYTAFLKYHGFNDTRGGGHFSGRITAPVTAAGAILQNALKKKGIFIATHIKECANISDRDFDDIKKDADYLDNAVFAVLDEEASKKMKLEIETAKAEGDSVGGILETVILGVPQGIGEPWFDTLEGVLAHALFSIPAVKGVEFGAGFAISSMRGSKANDAFRVKDGKIITTTNNSGGINGGISNGMPIIFRCAVKPTPTIFKSQETVNFVEHENVTLTPHGRHDPCIVHRARVVADSIAALCISDMLALRFGTDFLAEVEE